MKLVESFVKNPVAVAVGVLLLVLFGGIAIVRMPVQLTPEVQIPTLTIETRWPGASPQEVEREIVGEQEEQLKSVEGVTKLTSESMDSMGRITLEFSVGTNMSQALLMVNTRLQQVREYPEDADEPVISTSNASDRPIAWFILSARMPDDDTIQAFEQSHPELRGPLETVRQASNPGLAMHRLREHAANHAKLRQLLPPDIDVTTLRLFAEDVIEARLERVPGVSNANVLGGREEELQVVVDPERLAARQLTIQDVRLALRGQNQDTSGGDFWEGKRRYVVRTLGQFRSPEQVANVILARRDGVPVYVRDVAEVQLGFKKPDGVVRRFGGACIAINALRETGSNVLNVMDGLRTANAELNAGVLKSRGLDLLLVYDETEYIHSSIGLVTENLWEGGFLTLIVLLVFLRSLRPTLVIGVAIVVSFIGMFLMMYLMGRTLNVPSLAGLAFAVGMLVDNFIVVFENVFRRHQLGESAMTATVRGVPEVWGAIVTSTLANLAVFLPVLFVQEEAGQLFRDIAIAISAALAISVIVAITVMPTAAARFLKQQDDAAQRRSGVLAWLEGASGSGKGRALRGSSQSGIFARIIRFVASAPPQLVRPLDAFGRGFTRLVVGMNAWLQAGVLRRLVTLGLLIGGSVYLSYRMLPKVEYLPPGNRNLVIGILLPPPGYNLTQLTAMGQQIETLLTPYWDLDPGSPEAEKLDHPVIGDFFYVARGRSLFMGLRAADPLRAGDLVPLVQKVVSEMPGTMIVAKQTSLFEQGLSAGRTVDIEIVGPDLTKLIAIGRRVMGQVQQVIPGAQAFPRPSLDLSSPEVHVLPKWDQAADLGVNASDLGYMVDALVDGAYASDYYLGSDKIDLSIIGHQQFITRTQDLEMLPIATPSGQLVPLSAVASVRLGTGPEQVNHRERQRAVTIEVTPPRQVALEDAMDRISAEIVQPIVDSGELAGLYQINLAGTADKLRATWQAMRFNVILAVVITYLLMAALFGSWLYPFVIMLSVPLGAVGGFAGLWLLNQFVLQPLDVLTMLGFVILVGTVVNNPILIVEQALVHMREDGMPQRAAILESVRTRIRPIFMTALIGLFGLLPLVLAPGAGSELYRGLGSVLLGGLVVSTIFTLIQVPTLFSLTLDAREAVWRLLGWRSSTTAIRPDAEPLQVIFPTEMAVDSRVESSQTAQDAPMAQR
jgi:HAE1 family hydrophobic/amphiphilic exporter-1